MPCHPENYWVQGGIILALENPEELISMDGIKIDPEKVEVILN
jgi:hypothetical protein